MPLYVHAPYLINVASANNRVRIPSRKILQDTCDAAAEIGADRGDRARRPRRRQRHGGRLRALGQGARLPGDRRAGVPGEHRRRRPRDGPPLRHHRPAVGSHRRQGHRLLPGHLPRLGGGRGADRRRRADQGHHRPHRPGALQRLEGRRGLGRRPARQLRHRPDRPRAAGRGGQGRRRAGDLRDRRRGPQGRHRVPARAQTERAEACVTADSRCCCGVAAGSSPDARVPWLRSPKPPTGFVDGHQHRTPSTSADIDRGLSAATSPRGCPRRRRWSSMLHGGFGSAEQAERAYGWDQLADSAEVRRGLSRRRRPGLERRRRWLLRPARHAKTSTTSASSPRPSPTSPSNVGIDASRRVRHRHQQRRHDGVHAGVQHRRCSPRSARCPAHSWTRAGRRTRCR